MHYRGPRNIMSENCYKCETGFRIPTFLINLLLFLKNVYLKPVLNNT